MEEDGGRKRITNTIAVAKTAGYQKNKPEAIPIAEVIHNVAAANQFRLRKEKHNNNKVNRQPTI